MFDTSSKIIIESNFVTPMIDIGAQLSLEGLVLKDCYQQLYSSLEADRLVRQMSTMLRVVTESHTA